MRALAGCLLIAAAACGDDGGALPPSDGGGPWFDATSTTLRVEWVSMPPIPGPIMNDIVVTTVTFRLARLQIIGDGGSGSATTIDDVDLEWNDVRPTPDEIVFYNPPIGRYSTISLDAAAATIRHTFEITGVARIAGTMEPFRIYDTEPLDIDIDGYNVALEPGRSASMTVQLNLAPALLAVDYAQLPVSGGVRTLDDSDPQIITMREMLTAAFENP